MQVVTYHTDKFIIYKNNEKNIKLIYSYSIYRNKSITEIVKYNEDGIEHIVKINNIIPFDYNNPMKSINKFYKILMLNND